MVKCNICNLEKKIYARGQCNTCYQRIYKQEKQKWKIEICLTCGGNFEKKYASHQYCSLKCKPYKRIIKKKCSKCNRERLVRNNGLCFSCYAISHKKERR